MEGVYYLRHRGPAVEALPVDDNSPVVLRIAEAVRRRRRDDLRNPLHRRQARTVRSPRLSPPGGRRAAGRRRADPGVHPLRPAGRPQWATRRVAAIAAAEGLALPAVSGRGRRVVAGAGGLADGSARRPAQEPSQAAAGRRADVGRPAPPAGRGGRLGAALDGRSGPLGTAADRLLADAAGPCRLLGGRGAGAVARASRVGRADGSTGAMAALPAGKLPGGRGGRAASLTAIIRPSIRPKSRPRRRRHDVWPSALAALVGGAGGAGPVGDDAAAAGRGHALRLRPAAAGPVAGAAVARGRPAARGAPGRGGADLLPPAAAGRTEATAPAHEHRVPAGRLRQHDVAVRRRLPLRRLDGRARPSSPAGARATPSG